MISIAAPVLSLIQAFTAALLFSLSTPFAKLLLGNVQPLTLTGFLYLGCGLGVICYRFIREGHLFTSAEPSLKWKDLPWLAGSILVGGVGAPFLLMSSLTTTPAATASLLLSFEAIATTLVASLFFHEAIGSKIWLAIILVTGAGLLLSLQPDGQWGISIGTVGILGACFLWGMDNNFTRQISMCDPLLIVATKGICAGFFSLFLSFLYRVPFPGWVSGMEAMGLGSVSYGFSIVLFIIALRGLGAARTTSLFSISPFLGSLLSFIIFFERPPMLFYVALPIIGIGSFLLIQENHLHRHIHDEIDHEHRHRHDEGHHNHPHSSVIFPSTSHSHLHHHVFLEHDHSHVPDIHHRHRHIDSWSGKE
ncbi:MAG: EamA family transporter [Atribacterota bacterium]|nr:EamA family transporter [Candidatus Atribacteria bacterium]